MRGFLWRRYSIWAFRRVRVWSSSTRREMRAVLQAFIGLSGGLIGRKGTPRDYQGALQGTPVFLGCSDVGPTSPRRALFSQKRY